MKADSLYPDLREKHKEMTGLIVTGGTIDYESACGFLETRTFDKVIAVDGGLGALHKLHLKPDVIAGDFDTIDPKVLEEYKNSPDQVIWEVHKPEKDATDTELAISAAINLGCTKLVLLGATGGRLDHFLGNLHLLYDCLKRGVEAAIADEKNWITILDKGRSFSRNEAMGKYISFLPLSEEVKGITLTGFRYPLYKKDIDLGTSLCISNELVGEEGTIEFDSGILICVESHD